MDANGDEEYQHYISTRKSYDELETSQQDSLDKQMLALSGASLAFSIGFIEKIVPLNAAHWLIVLLFSWICFAISIVSTISSFKASILTCRDYIDQIDSAYENNESISSRLSSKWEKRIEMYNKAAYWFFISGLICLLVFLARNAII